MNDDEQSLRKLGSRAVACKHWRWMPGMLLQWRTSSGVVYRGRVCNIEEPDAVWCEGREDRFDWPELPKCWPDLSDPATLGCLLHLVREAWNACRISVCFSAYTPDATKRWSVPISYFKEQRDLVHVPSFYGSTQAEALVAALEAAP